MTLLEHYIIPMENLLYTDGKNFINGIIDSNSSSKKFITSDFYSVNNFIGNIIIDRFIKIKTHRTNFYFTKIILLIILFVSITRYQQNNLLVILSTIEFILLTE